MPDPSVHVEVVYTVPDREGGNDSFGFPSPTPYVSRDHENIHYGGDIWGAATNITLNGQIYLYESERGSALAGSPTGPDSAKEANANARFRELNKKKDAIIRAFSDDFGKLEIIDPSGPNIVVGEGCIIQSVDFSSNDYSGLVDYSITLKAYELSSFEAGRKILDPVDKFSFTEGNDGFIELTHSISAKGFNTNGAATDAFANAKAFVDSRKGLANKPTTTLINNTGAIPILVSLSENVDRFGATYSVTESYRYPDDPNFNGDFLTKYTVSKDESVESGITTVSIEGEIKSKKHNYILNGATPQLDDATMKAIRNEFKVGVKHRGQTGEPSIKTWHEICEADSSLDLNSYPVNFNTTEDERARVLTFNISFDNDKLFSDTDNSGFNLDNAYYDFTTSIDTDEMTSITTVGLSGLIKARGSLADRNKRVDGLLEQLITDAGGDGPYWKLKDEAETLYKDITGHGNFSLNYLPSSLTVAKNKFNGTINLAVQFNDKNFYPSYDIIESDYQVSLTPAMNQFRSKGSCNKVGSYIIYDINANSRERVDVSVNGKLMQFSSSDISKAKTEFKQIMDKFRDDYVLSGSKVQRLESERFMEGKHTRSLSLNSQFSCRKDDSFLTIDRSDSQSKTT